MLTSKHRKGFLVLHAHGGNVIAAAAEAGISPDEIFDFSDNVNPCPLPEPVRRAIVESVDSMARYADPSARKLRERAAATFGVSVDELLAGSGSTEFLYAVPRGLRPRRALVIAPCCHDYWRAIDHAGGEAEGVLAAEKSDFAPDMEQLEIRLSGSDMVIIGNPNNPTGVATPAKVIRTLASKFPSAIFLVDESLVEFVPESAGASLLGAPLPENAIVLRSLSLFHGMPGLRLGFMIASDELCGQVARAREPWTVSAVAQRAGEALFENGYDAAALREAIIAERERVCEELSHLSGLRVFQSQANFLLLRITKSGLGSAAFSERMMAQKILIRNAAGFRGLDNHYIRVSIRSAADNDRLLHALRNALDSSQWK